MGTIHVVKNAANKSQNLREFLKNVSLESKYDSMGLSEEIFDYNTKEDSNGNIIISLAVDSKGGARDRSIVKPYIEKFMAHEFTAEPYFNENDGEVYWLVKDFFESNFPSRDADSKLLPLCRFFNVLNRQVNNDLYAKYDTMWDKFCSSDIRKAYNTGKIITIKPKDGIFKKSWNRNPLKEAAWVVVHSYLIDKFMSENYQYRLIPKKPEMPIIIMWNHYIDMMKDVPDLVKTYYRLNENTGKSAFMYYYETEVMNTKVDKPNTGESTDEVKLETEHPVDDHEEGATVPFEDAIVVDTTRITTSVEELKANFENSIKEDNIIDTEFKLVPSTVDNSKKENQQDNKNEVPKKIETKEENIPKKEEKKVDTASTVKSVSRPIESDPTFDQNNKDTEESIPKLNRFTDLVRKNGYSVFYGSKPDEFPGIAIAILVNRKNPKEKRVLLLDPCYIYGDTLRVININNNLQNVDLKRCTFVAISQKEAVEKLIKGTFDKEDRKKNNEQLPRVLNDFREPYHFIDRVDLSNLQEITKKPDGKSISFNEWKKLVINISNILKNSSIPVCRFRVCEYTNCNKFKLICDDQVKISYISNIDYEPSQAQAYTQKFWVDYDPEKYGDANYAFGVMNNNVA
jgi:hypothetical protein